MSVKIEAASPMALSGGMKVTVPATFPGLVSSGSVSSVSASMKSASPQSKISTCP